ncbi:MAG: hypothetical protein PHR35_22045, partial [Kiritimatiellae bacterium]|nr:hypothetical protein [Kiritimatiellia bacterium]
MNSRRFIRGLVGLLGVSLAAVGWADGVTHYVSAAGSHTPPYTNWAMAAHDIQSAIDAVTVTPGIVLVTNDTYTLTQQVVIAGGVTVTSVNGQASTFINGGYPSYTNRCFYISHGDAVLDGFTISNGFLTANNGGGIYMTTGTVRNCAIVQNTALHGGGVYMTGGTIQSCTINSNVVQPGWPNYGGGVYCQGGLVRDCTLAFNVRNGTGDLYVYGLGIYMVGGVISNSTIRNHTANAALGGGVCMQGSAIARDCFIRDNSASKGGGIYILGAG